MSYDLPVEDAQLFRQAFESFDKNHDGLLSKVEFKQIFLTSGKTYSDKQINLYFRSIEPKSVGYIDFNGFLHLLFIGEACLSPKTIAKNLFKEYDVDGDGFIGYEEFRVMMKDIYTNEQFTNVENKIRHEFDYADADSSGQITLDEMAQILEAHMK